MIYFKILYIILYTIFSMILGVLFYGILIPTALLMAYLILAISGGSYVIRDTVRLK